MGAADLLSALSGGAVGLMLGLIGGGGSILATPALLYVVGVGDAHVAIGTSALAVSGNALANLLSHARRGNVKWPCAFAFSVTGVAGALAGSALGKLTDTKILLPLFAALMIVVGVSMLRSGRGGGDPGVRLSRRNAAKLAGAGAVVGLISGFFGIGGGFLIVPGLILATGMPMLNAVGASLLAVAGFGATTATSYALDGLIDWRIAGLFIAGGVVGGLVGGHFGARLASRKGALQRVFAVVVFAVAAYMLWKSAPALQAALSGG